MAHGRSHCMRFCIAREQKSHFFLNLKNSGFFKPVFFWKSQPCPVLVFEFNTIKGGSRRAEKSREVLMMMKAAKLGWAGSGAEQEQTMSRPGARLEAGHEQCKSREKARVGQEH